MNLHLCRLCCGILVTAMTGLVHGQSGPVITDPVGYTVHTIPGNSTTLLPLQLAKSTSFMETVTEVTPAGIRFARDISAGAFGSVGRGYMEVRSGDMAGLAIPATGISGNFLALERSPVGLVASGNFVSIREEQSLGELFGSPQYMPLQAGTSAEVADNVSIWDARTQTSKVFYYHTGLGWREAGKANEGDKSGTPIFFPSGVIVRRRAPTPVDVWLTGTVIIPLDQRYHPVWPGRNIISAPFTNSPTISHYIRPLLDAPHTVISAVSAPKADTLRFYSIDPSLPQVVNVSPVIYFRNSQWRVVGSNEDAGNTSLNLIPCLDLQRVGPAGYIRFMGVGANQASQAPEMSIAALVNEVKAISLNRTAAGLSVRWPAETGVSYQVQHRPVGSSQWRNLQETVQATSSTASLDFHPEGNACIRVIQL